MGLFDFLKPRPKMTPERADRAIDYGTFLVALDRTVLPRPEKPEPIELRISRFLMIGTDVALQTLALKEDGRVLSPYEGAGVVLHMQQGIHAMLTLYEGYDAVRTPRYREMFTRIFEFAIPFGLGSRPKSPSPECIEAMRLGTLFTRSAQAGNEPMLQRIFDAWQAFLYRKDDTGDDGSTDALSSSLAEAIEWSRSRS